MIKAFFEDFQESESIFQRIIFSEENPAFDPHFYQLSGKLITVNFQYLGTILSSFLVVRGFFLLNEPESC